MAQTTFFFLWACVINAYRWRSRLSRGGGLFLPLSSRELLSLSFVCPSSPLFLRVLLVLEPGQILVFRIVRALKDVLPGINIVMRFLCVCGRSTQLFICNERCSAYGLDLERLLLDTHDERFEDRRHIQCLASGDKYCFLVFHI